MIRRVAPLFCIFAATLWSTPSVAGSASLWWAYLGVSLSEETIGAGDVVIGAAPGQVDGYDGWAPYDIAGKSGIGIFHCRSAWAGPAGFYRLDYESPIPPGGSKTWPDIYLWSQDYTPQLGNRVEIGYAPDVPPPSGWWGHLVLDYVPADLNWDGPWDWWFPMSPSWPGWHGTVPVPVTDDPWNPDNVTRMHLTVYAVPEPSSLAALGCALAGLGIGVVRKQRS